MRVGVRVVGGGAQRLNEERFVRYPLRKGVGAFRSQSFPHSIRNEMERNKI